MSKNPQNQFYAYDTTGSTFKFTDIQAEYPENILDVIPELDVIYLNRVQNERRATSFQSYFILNDECVKRMKNDCIVLNPGPRQEELPDQYDRFPFNKIWEQVELGLYVRMAILRHIISSQS
jgi:aspartate carbamoyltransferase catalytic subunit